MNELKEYTERLFEGIKHIDENGCEFWYARELQKVLKYKEWRKFEGVISKAKKASENSNINKTDHFVGADKMINLGKGGNRNVIDYKLSRYACYLIAQNGDSRKRVIALAQTYFAIQTRKQELSEKEYNSLTEDEKRLYQRNLTRKGNYSLNIAAKNAGVKNFDKFHNSGYKGLYNGETANDIAKRKGLRYREDILDNMGSEELGANLFRITQTEASLREDNILGESNANETHYEVWKEIRRTIKMYVTQNAENTSLLDLTIVANGKIALPEDSSYLFSFYYVDRGPSSNLKTIEFNDSVGTSNVKNMEGMFALNNVTKYDLRGFDTSRVTNMSSMFEVYSFYELIEFNLSSFNTSNVTDMSDIFRKVHANMLDLSSFDTSNVLNMSGMFTESDIAEIKGLNKFNTSKVTDMEGMFNSNRTTTLDLSSFDTTNVVNMSSMFSNSQATEIKGLNKFNTSKVTNMTGMFAYSTVTTLDLGSFDTTNVTNMNNMFIDSKATTGYARTQADADKFNNSSNKPSSLTFVVK